MAIIRRTKGQRQNMFFGRQKFDADELFALRWKKPDSIEVIIRKSDGRYVAKVTNLSGNVVTQAQTGQELIEMVNDAVYAYLDIPEMYRGYYGYFLPPEDVREELKAEIPAKYLNKKIGLVKA